MNDPAERGNPSSKLKGILDLKKRRRGKRGEEGGCFNPKLHGSTRKRGGTDLLS